MAAQQLIDELNDYLDVIGIKIDRLNTSLANLQKCVSTLIRNIKIKNSIEKCI